MLTACFSTCITSYIILTMIQNTLVCSFAASLLLLLTALDVGAQETNSIQPDKSGYNLFNPVPDARMREFTPDRPDETESPYTVDAGHLQWEMDFANFTYNQTDQTTTCAWNAAPFNLRLGLLNQLELDLIFDNYRHVRTEDRLTGMNTTQSGLGDLTARLKINLWGDDCGKTAFALLPFVKLPTSTDGLGNNAVEGGMIFPFAVKLPGDFDLGLETAVSCLRNDRDHNYHATFINSVTLDHPIIGNLSGYLEFYSDLSTEPHAGWIGTVDAGFEFLVTKNVQLDCGCNFGATRAANNFNPFAGITVRF